MLSEKYNPRINQEKRKKTFSKLNMEEVDLLHSSDNPEYLAKEFDRIFLKLLRLIKYSQDRNKETISQLQQDTHNLLTKFINFVKNKSVDIKAMNEQEFFFKDICMFLNFFEGDSYFTKIHNSIGKTSLREYANKSLGEQMFHNMYGRERGMDKSCEGGSCSYWTILLYKFFNKLKEAGLNLNIKIYRYKNLDDEMMGCPTMRHSGLVINFQGKDYLVDYDGISIVGEGKIVKPIDSFIDVCDKVNDKTDKQIWENFKTGKQIETDSVIFFDNVDDLLQHVEIFPEDKKISLYVKVEDRVDPVKLDYLFTDKGVQIGINGKWKGYFLKDNKLNKKDFVENFMKKIGILRDAYGIHYITQHEMGDLNRCMNFIKDKINMDELYKIYTSNNERESELINLDGENKIMITQH